MRRLVGLSIAVLVTGSILLSAAWWIARKAAKRELEAARAEIRDGSYHRAVERLRGRSIRWADRAEVCYLLGVGEGALGNPGRALESLGQVPEGGAFSDLADLERARLIADAFGRFSDAEELLGSLLRREPRAEISDAAREVLAKLYQFQGRFSEIQRLIRSGWARSDRPAEALVRHWRLEHDPFPSESIRKALGDAALKAPADARIALGWAILALREGNLTEAERRLANCLANRPGDPAARRVQVELALASGSISAFREAAEVLPEDSFDPSERLLLRAWAATVEGEFDPAVAALDELLRREPAHSRALEHRIELALRSGDEPTTAELRRRKADADRTREAYRASLVDGVEPGEYGALAAAAEAMGRRFEAEGWWTLLLRSDPLHPEARLRLAGLREASARDHSSTTNSLAGAILGGLPAFGTLTDRPNGPRRPAGPRSAPAYVDEATASGLRFTFENGASPAHQLPETMAGGIGLLDADGDGWIDVYAVQGGRFPPPEVPEGPGDRLFRNRGDGTFEDVTETSGLPARSSGYGHGVAVGDIDNDGFPDLFLTRWRSYALWRNRGDGTFEDITERGGLGGDRGWPTSAAFADLDGDGDLDLYVCHYLRWDADHPRQCAIEGGEYPVGYCDPRLFPSEPDRLYRNDGGVFVDVTEVSGIVDRDGRGLGVVAVDLDDDGLIDLYVANDTTANFLFRNRGGMRFEEVGEIAGVAASADGGYQAGMGVDCADADGDGLPDLVVTNFYGEGSTLYRNLGGGQFVDGSARSGLSTATKSRLGFGVAFLDADHDGVPDLVQANGHVNRFRSLPYRMPAQLLLGADGCRWSDASDAAGPPWGVPRLGRAVARGDLENDGRIDVVIVGLKEPIADLRNRSPALGHSLTLSLEGTASNRDAVGATVAIEVGGRRQHAWRVGGGGYQSANDPRLHFGLGGATAVDSVVVTWPSGSIDRFEGPLPGAGYHLIEGDPTPRPLPIRPRRD